MTFFVSKSAQETARIARRLAKKLQGGNVVLLEGELGSGKTTFVKGLAAALGIRERITSPTFVLMHTHRLANSKRLIADGKRKTISYRPYAIRYLIHIDAYRVKHARELRDVGLLDWLGRNDTLVVVEWGEKIQPLLRGRRAITITFRHGKKPNERMITLQLRKPPPRL